MISGIFTTIKSVERWKFKLPFLIIGNFINKWWFESYFPFIPWEPLTCLPLVAKASQAVFEKFLALFLCEVLLDAHPNLDQIWSRQNIRQNKNHLYQHHNGPYCLVIVEIVSWWIWLALSLPWSLTIVFFWVAFIWRFSTYWNPVLLTMRTICSQWKHQW